MATHLLRCQRIAITSVQRAARYQSTAASTSTSTSLQSTDLLEYYRGLVARGDLKWDDEQARCVMHLKKLLVTLEDYEPSLELMDKLLPRTPPSFDYASNSSTSWFKGQGRKLVKGADAREKQLVRVLTGEEELAALQTPKGILITGPPGTGKSLLLSLFFSLLPTPKKRRHHYHAFLLSLYQQVFQEMEKRRLATPKERPSDNMDTAGKRGWKAVFAGGRWEGKGEEVGVRSMPAWTETQEAIPFVIARRMIDEYHVLYFDELQLVDASSASLLRDVLSWYWRLGGIVVSCSNRVPDDLYHHGVQKERMAGFLDALKSRCEVIELDGGVDWRQREEDAAGVKKRWLTGDAQGEIEKRWTDLLAGQEAKPSSVNVYGRKVPVPLASGSVCRFSFEALCEEPLGPADYISLASAYRTFVIDNVPVLYLRHKNEARRLINLVDALYESRCQVIITGEATPETMFFPDAFNGAESSSATNHKELFDDSTNDNLMAAEALSETLHEPARPNVSVYNPSTPAAQKKLETRTTGSFSVLSIFTGEDERFAYKRAVSRLIEMTRSPTYAKEEWLPLGAEGRQWERLAVTKPQTVSLKSLGVQAKPVEPSKTEEAPVTAEAIIQPPSPPTEGFAARRLDFDSAMNSSLFSKAPTTRTARSQYFVLRAAPASSIPPPSPHPFPEAEAESSSNTSPRVPFGLMVSKKKVSNSAVERNRVRTRFKEAVRKVATAQALGDPLVLPDHAYLATLHPEIYDAPFEKLCDAVRKALDEIRTPKRTSIKARGSRSYESSSRSPRSFNTPRASEDFGDEAGYSRPDKLSSMEDRMSKGPPKIGEHHAWGMAEGWGKKAGRWGLGAAVFGSSSRGDKKGG